MTVYIKNKMKISQIHQMILNGVLEPQAIELFLSKKKLKKQIKNEKRVFTVELKILKELWIISMLSPFLIRSISIHFNQLRQVTIFLYNFYYFFLT